MSSPSLAPSGRNAAPVIPANPAQSWRDLATTAATLVFETDAEGRLTHVGPERALGWESGALLGRAGRTILADLGRDDMAGVLPAFDPFRPGATGRHRRCWLRRGDGGTACLAVSVMPVIGADGQAVGARGMGIDLAELDGTELAVADALRRADVLDYLLRDLRVELVPARMMQQLLRLVAVTLGAEGALVVDAAADGPAGPILYQVGGDAGGVTPAACEHLRFGFDGSPALMSLDDRPAAICPCPTRFGGQTGLVLWRRANGRRWDQGDAPVLKSVTGLVRVVMEHCTMQSEMAVHARTDALTGLANRRAFQQDVPRHIERLDRDRQPGTMMLVTLDHFQALNDRCGHDVGDEALRIATNLLRVTFRPGDVVARLGGAEFAVWMNGADTMTAAERAEALCTDGIAQFNHLGAGVVRLGLCVGIAMRWPDGQEDTDDLRTYAGLAIDAVRRSGATGWKVWHP